MTALTMAPLLLAAVPALAATLGLVLWRNPETLKVWLLLGTVASFGAVAWASGALPAEAAPLPLLFLLPLMALLSLLAQPAHRNNRASWLLTLGLLGLGLGVLASEPSLSAIFFLILLAAIGLVLLSLRGPNGFHARWGIAGFALGALSAAGALTTGPPFSSVAFTLACATALPLMPFHKGYVAALTALPGNLPAFLAVVLPVAGFHGLPIILPKVPSAVAESAGVLALVGSLYGSLRALTQARAASVVAYGSAAFLSILWWYLVTTGTAPSHSLAYLCSVGLATSGLLLAWYQLRARYGEISLRSLSGLAQGMPRFALAVSLLALAACGLPPFGLYAGFIGMVLAPSFTWSSGSLVMLVAWLSASWYLFDLVQGMLFGRQRQERRHEDLRGFEWVSLAIVLALLTALGLVPSQLFDTASNHTQRTVVMEFTAWNN